MDLGEDALRWVQWSCLHRSYLYESIPESPLSAEALDLLATLGSGWMRMAILDRARSRRGDFASNAEVSAVLAADKQARSALGAWVNSIDSAFYGKGEAAILAAGTRSAAPEKVAMQILGALSLITASQAPADSLLELISFEPSAPEPDWLTLLLSKAKREPKFTRADSGPDHDKLFTVTVAADGRSASATAPSIKAAKKQAARSYVLQHMSWAVPATPNASTIVPRPLPYRGDFPQHARARRWAQQAFEVADSGLISQALTHRSWAYENRRLVAEAHQRDYGTMATEGSEALTNLIRHSYALHTLDSNFRVPSSAVTTPALPRDVVVELFDLMPVAGGVLRSSGTDITLDIKEDVTQSIIGAAWRANGDLLMERQPATLARWIQSFTPASDPATQLQEYCARIKAGYLVDFEQRGPDHKSEYRATITFDVEGRPRWRGGWSSAMTPAKQSAADNALRYLFGQDSTELANSDQDGHALLRGMLLAELHAIDPDRRVNTGKELAVGRLGVDMLAAGIYGDYLRWANVRSRLLPRTGSAVTSRLSHYYETVLKQQRREAVQRWICKYLPTLETDVPDAARSALLWREGEAPGHLALLEELLAAIQKADPVKAVLEYVELKAQAVAAAANATLECSCSTDAATQTLSLRLSGAGLSDALEPVAEAVDCIVTGGTWSREAQAVSVTIPNTPIVTDLVSRSGVEAVQRALQDPWIERTRYALNSFLKLVERVLSGTTTPTLPQLEEIASSEHSLISQLRADC